MLRTPCLYRRLTRSWKDKVNLIINGSQVRTFCIGANEDVYTGFSKLKKESAKTYCHTFVYLAFKSMTLALDLLTGYKIHMRHIISMK